MRRKSYGISTPQDLFEKLGRDANKMTGAPSADDTFNFFVTANSLYDWIEKHYGKEYLLHLPFRIGGDKREWIVPIISEEWLDLTKIPGKTGGDVAIIHIKNSLELSRQIANASKHYHWTEVVTDISINPVPKNWYQYYTHQPNAGLCFEIGNYTYSVEQLAHIITAFYRGILAVLSERHSESAF